KDGQRDGKKDGKPGRDKESPKDKDKEEEPKEDDDPPPGEVSPVSPELTNLIPRGEKIKQAEHVVHYFFNALLGPLRDAARGSFPEGYFEKNLGFAAVDIDDLIHADRYSAPAWSFTIVHTQKALDLAALKKALGLESAGKIKRQEYYRVTRNRGWLEQFGRVSLGAPQRLRPPAR